MEENEKTADISLDIEDTDSIELKTLISSKSSVDGKDQDLEVGKVIILLGL